LLGAGKRSATQVESEGARRARERLAQFDAAAAETAEKSPPLENYANNSSPSPRNRRYMLRSALWDVSSLKRCRSCGKHVREASGEVGIRVTEGHAGFAGLVTCGSVWVCPVCSAKIAATRSVEIGCVVARALSEGCSVVMVTLTLRHDRGQALGLLWDSLAGCWKRVTGGKSWVRQVERFGLLGFVRATEVTHGQNGWHPHVHALLISERDLSSSEVDELCTSMWERWASKARGLGLRSPLMQASEWHRVTADGSSGTSIGDYLAKGVLAAGAIGMELTQTQSKVARSVHSTRSMWEVLREAVEVGEAGAVRLWLEWERVSKGRRSIAWSRGLRERFGVGLEKSDEEIAAEELGGRDDTIAFITRAGWASMVRRPVLMPALLDALESGGIGALHTFLSENNIEWRPA
jgi:hypothetical protein